MQSQSTWSQEVVTLARKVVLPADDSHKGQNGKLLIVGGSELFHAASKWSLDVASKVVDMVFYASVPGNNALIQEAKGQFWNGIVIEMASIQQYAEEADCILIGPGMTRTPDTEETTRTLITSFPNKRMVIDAGALQMIDPSLLGASHVVTPHKQEFIGVYEKVTGTTGKLEDTEIEIPVIEELSKRLHGTTILLKGQQDYVVQYAGEGQEPFVVGVDGGHPGMTKGGTGDVLAGLVAALYCKSEATVAATVASAVCKRAGETLAEKTGPYFNASDLVEAIPEQLWNLVSFSRQ